MKNAIRNALSWIGLSIREFCALAVLSFGLFVIVHSISSYLGRITLNPNQLAFGLFLSIGAAFILVKELLGHIDDTSHGAQRSIKNVILAVGLTLLIAGVGLGVPVTALARTLSEVQSSTADLNEYIAELESEVGRFDSENWRSVVPDVQIAIENVRSAYEDLEARVTW